LTGQKLTDVSSLERALLSKQTMGHSAAGARMIDPAGAALFVHRRLDWVHEAAQSKPNFEQLDN
jgi:hypothetical protein